MNPTNNMYSNLNKPYNNPYANVNHMNTYPNNYSPSLINGLPPNYNHIIQDGYPTYVHTPMPALPATNKF